MVLQPPYGLIEQDMCGCTGWNVRRYEDESLQAMQHAANSKLRISTSPIDHTRW